MSDFYSVIKTAAIWASTSTSGGRSGVLGTTSASQSEVLFARRMPIQDLQMQPLVPPRS